MIKRKTPTASKSNEDLIDRMMDGLDEDEQVQVCSDLIDLARERMIDSGCPEED